MDAIRLEKRRSIRIDMGPSFQVNAMQGNQLLEARGGFVTWSLDSRVGISGEKGKRPGTCQRRYIYIN